MFSRKFRIGISCHLDGLGAIYLDPVDRSTNATVAIGVVCYMSNTDLFLPENVLYADIVPSFVRRCKESDVLSQSELVKELVVST